MFFLLLCFVPVMLIAQLNFLPPLPSALFSDIALQLGMVLVVLGALMMMFRLFPSLDFYAVYIRKQYALPSFIKGVFIGSGIILACAALLYFNGNVSFEKQSINWLVMLPYIIYFLLIAAFEEFLFRSYPLHAFAERYPLWFAVFFNSILFTLAHAANPGVTPIGLTNIMLASILLGLYVLHKQNIAWAVGIHFGWNFTQAIALGYNVSGNAIEGVGIKAMPIGENYLSGGGFGVEGSVFCTALLVLLLLRLAYKYRLALPTPLKDEGDE